MFLLLILIDIYLLAIKKDRTERGLSRWGTLLWYRFAFNDGRY